MTDAPTNATVLDTTVLSNFTHVDCAELLLNLPRLVTVDTVREELEAGAETHFYIERALAVLGEEVPVINPICVSREAGKATSWSLETAFRQGVGSTSPNSQNTPASHTRPLATTLPP